MADNESWEKQLDGAARAEHPGHDWAQSLGAEVEAAVDRLAADLAAGENVGRQRSQALRVLRRAKESLVPVNARIDGAVVPHIARVPERADVALLYVLGCAAEVPEPLALATGYAVGFEPVGDIPPSGWWPPEVRRAEAGDLAARAAARAHDGWIDALTTRIRREAAREGGVDEAAQVWEKTLSEVERRLMHGPFTRAELDAAYGHGRWRAMQRFGVWQRGKLRPCDNARASGHNDATSTFERMLCENADFPARVAVAFQAAADRLGVPMWRLLAGTEDLSDAYRHVPTSAPEFTVVALWSPGDEDVRFFTLPGFNFGLKAAVPQFNRYAETVAALANALLGVVCVHFFDDFCCCEPAEAAASGQRSLRELQALLGAAFAEAKSVAPAAVVVFLGVESDLSEAASAGVVRMRVRPERVARLVDSIAQILDDGVMAHSAAASLAGRLQFTLSWAFGRIGRAALQPLHAEMGGLDRQARDGFARGGAPALTAGQRAALRFFEALLPELPPHEVALRRSGERPVLILSDARWEEEPEAGEAPYDEPGAVGFLVAVPRPGTPPEGPTSEPGAGLTFLKAHYDPVSYTHLTLPTKA